MGCDMHMFIESCNKGVWEPVYGSYKYGYIFGNEGPTKEDCLDWFYTGCDYNLFSYLADVRNDGSIKPISEPRGIPTDISDDINDIVESYGADGHSHSWYTLAELLDCKWGKDNDQDYFIKNLEFLKEISFNDGKDIRLVFFFDN